MSLERIVLPNGNLPHIIQGGMGVAVSNWELARTVSMRRQLGVVSGTGIEVILARRLQDGDKNGKMREAMEKFPIGRIAEEVLERYFVEGGKNPDQNYKPVPFPKLKQEGKNLMLNNRRLEELIILANFVEVHLAKEGHDGIVGINLLYKVQHMMPQSLYGAMLADVDAVLIGAGIPKPVPDVLDALVQGEKISMPFHVTGGKDYTLNFNPLEVMGEQLDVRRPDFIGIITNQTGMRGLPNADGYVFENPSAGGHNAPPRNKGELNDLHEPDYGKKDEINMEMVHQILSRRNDPQSFWFAGGYANRLHEAFAEGAAGVQIGTPFAFSKESGIELEHKLRIREVIRGGAEVFSDARASPTGFPFQVLSLEGSLSENGIYTGRERVCDQGYLLEFFENGEKVESRCASELERKYISKGGNELELGNRKCICNALISLAGFPSTRKGGYKEPILVTSGKDTSFVKTLMHKLGDYTANDVIDLILEK